MSRHSSMTIGLVLIFLGVQLFLVKSYLLTPTATRFVEEHFNANNDSQFSAGTANNQGLFSSGTGQSSIWSPNRQGTLNNNQAGASWPYYRTNGGSGSWASNSNWNSGGDFQNGSFRTASATSSFGPGKRFVPPSWIMWPVLVLGAVFFFHGIALRA